MRIAQITQVAIRGEGEAITIDDQLTAWAEVSNSSDSELNLTVSFAIDGLIRSHAVEQIAGGETRWLSAAVGTVDGGAHELEVACHAADAASAPPDRMGISFQAVPPSPEPTDIELSYFSAAADDRPAGTARVGDTVDVSACVYNRGPRWAEVSIWFGMDDSQWRKESFQLSPGEDYIHVDGFRADEPGPHRFSLNLEMEDADATVSVVTKTIEITVTED